MANTTNASLDGGGSSHSCDNAPTPCPFEDRPDRISITIHRADLKVGLGISLDEFGRIMEIDDCGLLIIPSPTIPDECLLQPNDVVERINGLPWDPSLRNELDTACGSLVFVFQTNVMDVAKLPEETKEEGATTTINPTTIATEETTCKQWILNQAVVILPETSEQMIHHGIQLRSGRHKTVWTFRIASDIWKFSALQPNQRILAVGSTSAPATREQTYELLEHLPRVLSVTTLGKKPSSWTLRKAAVGFGGSAMVGVGAVLMVTPLHPVGHVMALSGMGVLGTEFEGPRKAMQYPRQAFDFTKKKLFRTASNTEVPGQDTTEVSGQEATTEPQQQQVE